MPKCCTNCFRDNVLREFIDSNGVRGRCGFCSSVDVNCIAPDSLAQKFEWLFSVAEENEDGKRVEDFLDHYFCLFSDSVTNRTSLTREIFGSSISEKMLTFEDDGASAREHWSEFKTELISENRYFPKKEIYKSFFSNNRTSQEAIFTTLLEQLSIEIYPTECFFRARVSDDVLTSQFMGAPPKHLATSGRANPRGISYLYVAENVETAISEVRPFKSSNVYVSKAYPAKDMKFIDLTQPRQKSSPFQLDEDNYTNYLYIINLLESFSTELSIPVKPHKSELEYVPTQYICEYIKSLEVYDGIVYESSFSRGKNFVIFNEDSFDIREPEKYTLTDIQYDFESA